MLKKKELKSIVILCLGLAAALSVGYVGDVLGILTLMRVFYVVCFAIAGWIVARFARVEGPFKLVPEWLTIATGCIGGALIGGYLSGAVSPEKPWAFYIPLIVLLSALSLCAYLNASDERQDGKQNLWRSAGFSFAVTSVFILVCGVLGLLTVAGFGGFVFVLAFLLSERVFGKAE